MKYRRSEAKDHARANMKGIWAAALMPFAEDLAIDEKGFRRNLRHWVDDLGIDGVFIAGKQSEFFSMSIAERKRSMEIVVDEIGKTSGVIASCSDQNSVESGNARTCVGPTHANATSDTPATSAARFIAYSPSPTSTHPKTTYLNPSNSPV